MTLPGTLEEAWALAATRPLGNGLRVMEFEDSGTLAFATVTDDGHRGVLLFGRSGDLLPATAAAVHAASEALDAEIFRTDIGGRSVQGIHLWCAREDLGDAFGAFCNALVARVCAGDDVYPAFLDCLEEFRRLLAEVSDRGGRSALVGLLGELIVLADMTEFTSDALRFWAYPDRDRHDFRNGRTALEVKATLRSQSGGALVSISSLDQLVPPNDGELYLQWIKLERDPAGDISIDALTHRIGLRLPLSGREVLRGKLGAMLTSSSAGLTFSLQDRRAFRVTDQFPRLTPDRLSAGALDPGVSRISYDVDLAAAETCRCTPAEATRLFVNGTHEADI